jgi:glycosyltransferase involved in cell wall biosynthesis
VRILHAVEFYPPAVGGVQEVVRQLSERLAARGHEVTVATSSDPRRSDGGPVRVAGFDVRGNEVRGLEGDVEAYRRFVLEEEWDLVMTYAAQQWTTDALLPLLGDVRAPVVLAPCGFSALHNPAYAPYFAMLRERLHDFDALIFHSEGYQDTRFAREAGAEGIEVIPNAADEREFGTLRERGRFRAAHGIGDQEPLLLTVGGHTGLKGHAQSMATLRAMSERATLAVVGNTPTGRGCLPQCRVRAAVTRLKGRRVLLLDPPREQVLDAYADADLFVFCSMVECSPIVLFESMAAGLPFVSVDVGNAAEIAEWSGAGVIVSSRRRADGLVEADPQAVASAVDALLADPERRRAMGESGRRAWEERFTWEAIARRYEELYLRLAA